MVDQVYPQQQHSSRSAADADADAAAQVLVEMQHDGSGSTSSDRFRNIILTAFENHPWLKRKLDNNREYKSQIKTISAMVAAKLQLVF